MQILIGTDGTRVSKIATDFGVMVARAASAELTLFGVATTPNAETNLRAAFAEVQRQLPVAAHEKISAGQAADEIIAEARSSLYDFLIVGSRGRRGLARLLFGSVASRLARYSPIPALIVKGRRTAVLRVLACTSGDARGERPARWAGQIAQWFNAEVTILHVMSQMLLAPGVKQDELGVSADTAIADATREGQHLQRAMALVREHGARNTIRPRLRYGLVLEEVVAEANEGDYDLIVIGAHESPLPNDALSGLAKYLFDDVADQIISALNRPVLVVRSS